MTEFSQEERDEWARQVLSGRSGTVAQLELRLRLSLFGDVPKPPESPKATEEPEQTTAGKSPYAPEASDLDG